MADDPTKVPPPKPREPFLTSLAIFASKNWRLFSFFGFIIVLAIFASCCLPDSPRPRKFKLAEEVFDDEDTSSPNFGSRTYGNVPLSEQPPQRQAAAAQAAAAGATSSQPSARSVGNVPLSQQEKPHTE